MLLYFYVSLCTMFNNKYFKFEFEFEISALMAVVRGIRTVGSCAKDQ